MKKRIALMLSVLLVFIQVPTIAAEEFGVEITNTGTITEANVDAVLGALSLTRDSKITKVTLSGGGTVTIGEEAFKSFRHLKNIILSNNTVIGGIENDAFYMCGSLVGIGATENETTANIDEVNSIGDRAFYGCQSLANVVFSTNLTEIGKEAFKSCVSLKNDTNGLNFSNKLKTIGDAAFESCTALEFVRIADTNDEDKSTSIGNTAFINCTSLKEAYIPTSVETIGDGAFYKNSNLTIYVDRAYNQTQDEPFGDVSFDPSWNFEVKETVWKFQEVLGDETLQSKSVFAIKGAVKATTIEIKSTLIPTITINPNEGIDSETGSGNKKVVSFPIVVANYSVAPVTLTISDISIADSSISPLPSIIPVLPDGKTWNTLTVGESMEYIAIGLRPDSAIDFAQDVYDLKYKNVIPTFNPQVLWGDGRDTNNIWPENGHIIGSMGPKEKDESNNDVISAIVLKFEVLHGLAFASSQTIKVNVAMKYSLTEQYSSDS